METKSLSSSSSYIRFGFDSLGCRTRNDISNVHIEWIVESKTIYSWITAGLWYKFYWKIAAIHYWEIEQWALLIFVFLESCAELSVRKMDEIWVIKRKYYILCAAVICEFQFIEYVRWGQRMEGYGRMKRKSDCQTHQEFLVWIKRA